jgi:Leucine-rich repeat (LRR) protein
MSYRKQAVLQRVQQCTGSTLDLSKCDLTSFPIDALGCAQFRTINAANNSSLQNLPDDLAEISDVQTLFFLGCGFKSTPTALGQLKKLYMLSFKSQCNGGLTGVPDESLPEQLGWLILTENALRTLPPRLGTLAHMRKLMLASNQLSSLPDFSGCVSLELLRLSDNSLDEGALGCDSASLSALLSLPKLA